MIVAPLAQVVHDYREETSGDEYVNDISDAMWYRNVPGFRLIEGEKLAAVTQLITTSSDLFSIESTATRQDVSVAARAVVRRVRDDKTGAWKCEVHSWQYF